MNIFEAEQLAKEKILKYLDSTVLFKFNNRKTSLGTWRRRRGITTIFLSRIMVVNNNKERVLNTILHEIAHELDYRKRGRTNHDIHWKSIAWSIGCDGERCHDFIPIEKINEEIKKTAKNNLKSFLDLHIGETFISPDKKIKMVLLKWNRKTVNTRCENNRRWKVRIIPELLVEVV
jgi:predicted SprT family Zn-dependent metalloprotease